MRERILEVLHQSSSHRDSEQKEEICESWRKNLLERATALLDAHRGSQETIRCYGEWALKVEGIQFDFCAT